MGKPGGRIGVHASVWVGGWRKEDCEHAVREAVATGYDYIEMPVLDPYGIDIAHTRRTLERAGLGMTASLGLDESTDISSEDRAIVARGAALLDRALAVVRDAGGTDLCGVIHSAMRKYMQPASPRGIANAEEVLRRLAEAAEAAGIGLHLEVVNRYESNVLNTGAQAVAMIERIGVKSLKVHLDTYHMNIEEGAVGPAIEACGARLGYFHVGESHRGYLGTGTVDFAAAFRSLARIGYAGPIAFESFSSAVVDPKLSAMLGVWRNLWSDGSELARHARQLIEAERVAAEKAMEPRAG
jgi:D-psicose/D-tagatose/L-ribulose 3-epimerase